jgi:CheY-like chemotaxis protein
MDSLKVLIVDDDELIRWSLVRFLSNIGHQVVSAGNGSEALALAATQRFDFVITDLAMPELDGWKLLEKLMELPHPPRVIVMTAQEERDNYRKVVERGGWAYLEKTHLLDGVTEALRTVSAGYHSNQPNQE